MKIHHSITTLLVTASAAWATPSGLNNIPTADTTPQRTIVLQAFSTLSNDRDADFNLGFKTGLDFKLLKFEFGADSHITPGKGGPVTANVKAAIPLGVHLPVLAAGVANITFDSNDRRRAGDEFAYFVASQDFGWLRIHGGCGLQDGDALPFAGIDKTFRRTIQTPAPDGKAVKDGKSHHAAMETKTIDLFTLRADAIEQRDSDWLYSAGVLVPVCKWFVLETWGNFPAQRDSASWTIKGNFVFTF